MSPSEIAYRLNAEGVPTKLNSRLGWAEKTVSNLVSQEFYAGRGHRNTGAARQETAPASEMDSRIYAGHYHRGDVGGSKAEAGSEQDIESAQYQKGVYHPARSGVRRVRHQVPCLRRLGRSTPANVVPHDQIPSVNALTPA